MYYDLQSMQLQQKINPNTKAPTGYGTASPTYWLNIQADTILSKEQQDCILPKSRHTTPHVEAVGKLIIYKQGYQFTILNKHFGDLSILHTSKTTISQKACSTQTNQPLSTSISHFATAYANRISNKQKQRCLCT